jgi:hypothetical protein
MTSTNGPLRRDDAFLHALVIGDSPALDGLLADDFAIVDVLTGADIDKRSLLRVIASGELAFATITPAERRVRLYGGAAVVNGRTQMAGELPVPPSKQRAATRMCSRSRASIGGSWLAQGTQIADESARPRNTRRN